MQIAISLRVDGSGVAGDPIHGISGLVLDLDFDAPSTLTITSGDVESVVNKASQVVWTEATARPDYDATGLNGHGCAIGDGVDGIGTKKIISTEAAVFAALTSAHAFTYFIVSQYAAADSQGTMFGVADSAEASTGSRRFGSSTSGSGRQLDTSTNDAATTVSVVGGPTNDTNPHVIEWYSPGTTVSCQVDGAAANPSGGAHNPGTLTPSRSAIFVRADSVPDIFGNGKIGRVVLFNRELTSAERSTVRVTLGAQFGITVTA